MGWPPWGTKDPMFSLSPFVQSPGCVCFGVRQQLAALGFYFISALLGRRACSSTHHHPQSEQGRQRRPTGVPSLISVRWLWDGHRPPISLPGRLFVSYSPGPILSFPAPELFIVAARTPGGLEHEHTGCSDASTCILEGAHDPGAGSQARIWFLVAELCGQGWNLQATPPLVSPLCPGHKAGAVEGLGD
mgnify:CR=1 FL=1